MDRRPLKKAMTEQDDPENDKPIPEEVWPNETPRVEEPYVRVPFEPEPPGETVRQSGLAWSAGIVFFGAVAFMLFLGWGADLVLGSAPWGVVGGIVLGSIIGFIQFFRISSQIFPSKKPHKDIHTLMSRDDEDEE